MAISNNHNNDNNRDTSNHNNDDCFHLEKSAWHLRVGVERQCQVQNSHHKMVLTNKK